MAAAIIKIIPITPLRPNRSNSAGFTIVELLIVIVVIGILAAITIVSFTGIQSRAKSVSIVSAAQQVQDLFSAYKAAYGIDPPMDSGQQCLTVDNSCTNWGGVAVAYSNATLMSELRKVGNPPQSVPHLESTYYGLYLDSYAPRSYNHVKVPGLLMYWLPSNQTCGLANVVVSVAATGSYTGEADPYATSTTGYTATDASRTSCWVSV